MYRYKNMVPAYVLGHTPRPHTHVYILRLCIYLEVYMLGFSTKIISDAPAPTIK